MLFSLQLNADTGAAVTVMVMVMMLADLVGLVDLVGLEVRVQKGPCAATAVEVSVLPLAAEAAAAAAA